MTNEQEDKIINNLIIGLGTYALGNIKDSRNIHKPPVNINMLLGTFILCSCFIDQMAQIRYFDQKGMGNRFRKFVKEYLGPQYKPGKLYDSLRSRLVHNYSVQGKYWLTDGREFNHLEPIKGRIYLNIDDFIADIETAWKRFKNDLLSNYEVRELALKHEKKFPVLKEGFM